MAAELSKAQKLPKAQNEREIEAFQNKLDVTSQQGHRFSSSGLAAVQSRYSDGQIHHQNATLTINSVSSRRARYSAAFL